MDEKTKAKRRQRQLYLQLPHHVQSDVPQSQPHHLFSHDVMHEGTQSSFPQGLAFRRRI